MAPNQFFSTLGKTWITSIWIEATFYGFNLVLFGVCVYVLTGRQHQVHWANYLSCIIHISLSTAHTIISFVQVFNAFVVNRHELVANPHRPDIDLEMPSALYVANFTICVANDFALNMILFWRLYIVWNCNRKLALLLLILETVHTTCAATAIYYICQAEAALFSSRVQIFATISWCLHISINTSVTAGIAYRLWRASMHLQPAAENSYYSAMWTVIESGALVLSATIVTFTIDRAGSPAVHASTNVSVQVATLTPLLIIVRIALGLTHKKRSTIREQEGDQAASCPMQFIPPPSEDLEIIECHRRRSAEPHSL